MTSETQNAPEDAVAEAKVRPPLTPEQREQKNARDRKRRAEAKAARLKAKQPSISYSGPANATFEGTIGQQQAQRDKPFKQALSALLQAQDKARADRIRNNQQRPPEARKSERKSDATK